MEGAEAQAMETSWLREGSRHCSPRSSEIALSPNDRSYSAAHREPSTEHAILSPRFTPTFNVDVIRTERVYDPRIVCYAYFIAPHVHVAPHAYGLIPCILSTRSIVITFAWTSIDYYLISSFERIRIPRSPNCDEKESQSRQQ